jgi:FKBP-type peptidyl-prolyl cis-trans isomerase
MLYRSTVESVSETSFLILVRIAQWMERGKVSLFSDRAWVTTDSELKYRDFKQGGGTAVKLGEVVTVHYMVANCIHEIEDGPWLDNSWKRNEPVPFKVGEGQVIKGVDEGIQGMNVAGHRRLIVPPELAFGKRGVPGIVPPDTTLCIELYLIEIGGTS